MSISEAFFLGILQGITEFLPISSSGHLVLASQFFSLPHSENFIILLLFHAATVLSISVIFFPDIIKIIKGVFKNSWNEEKKLVAQLLFSALPIFILGIFFQDKLKLLFENSILLVAAMFFLTSCFLFLSYKKKETKKKISFLAAFLLGISQMFAVLPGLSRSGITIATGILLGCDRKKVTQFSFLMLIVPVLGGSFLELIGFIEKKKEVNTDFIPLMVGFLTAFIVGCFCCWWMKQLVIKNKLIYFAFYCLILSTYLFFSL